MGIHIETSESQHIMEIAQLSQVGQTDFEKIGHISAALLILTKLNSYVNQRKEVLDKVVTILVKLVGFSRSTESYKDIVTCLTIVLIKTFLVDLGSASVGGQTLQNLKDLLEFLFEILNSQTVNCSVRKRESI